jgi:hypothetical protein
VLPGASELSALGRVLDTKSSKNLVSGYFSTILPEKTEEGNVGKQNTQDK